MSAPRILSLIASATEITCALGLEDQMVGRSHECDYPESVSRLPVCTAPKFDVSGTSREVDERVKALLRDALSVYRVDEETLKALAPDVILTQSHCEVCAVSLRNVEEAVRRFLPSHPRIVSLEPNALADIWKDFRIVAEALGVPERGAELVARCRKRMEEVSGKARASAERPAVACIEWIDPLMVAGNWVPELVEMAGGGNLFGRAGEHAPWMRWEELCASDPDIITIMPCGYDIGRSREEMPPLTGRSGWEELRAVREGRVFLTDGNQYFNRPGPRLVESLEILAEILHPEIDLGTPHRGAGWEPL